MTITSSDSPYRSRPVFAVAPMIDWTDRHCRFFHRQLSAHALLYTEMVVADAIIHGPRDRLLAFDEAEHPVALQVGGSDPRKLAEAVRIARSYGYDEFGLNVGCPSDRVQSGTFGACLMREPGLVGDCLAAMVEAADGVPVTVKCRLGVDEQDIEPALDDLADAAVGAGVEAIWVHARKAWLKGLSPKENRDIPPLDYDRVGRLKARLPSVFVGLNGGIGSLEEGRVAMETGGLDGIMMGRAAYQTPDVLTDVDHVFYRADPRRFDHGALIATMERYAAHHIENGGKLNQVTRHMIGLFNGLPGARRWRQILSTRSTDADAHPGVIGEAFAEIRLPAELSAA
ncbi:tRNA dihydrouridine(20/20a) synthase DusA [Fulvimarina endophytica]|uniref:tRNA-dihydrouridine(20/20a) synthase n=1 Tax=Fulvimarina endophytica TaxID=2293836 RepID=A0A371XA23_9HYPH|nr:tRNA dihydrouridine(20/20a) synthase DusA [Fulvimarina endophytica]RFC66083.1 tRNA dihydrouridine(20/20a) synthase DusA [Fulvimarina endophytica]